MSSPNACSSDVDVLVVGAGPVGLLMASEIRLGRASVRILERTTSPSETIKAGSINLASGEILARRGLLNVARAAHKQGVCKIAEHFSGALNLSREEAEANAACRVIRAGHFAAIPLDNELVDLNNRDVAEHKEALDATFIAQREIETLLEDHAASLGVEILRGIEVTGIEQFEDWVVVHSHSGDVRAKYVVGCDGGRSVVRKFAGFAFPGSDAEITGRQAVVDLDDITLLRPGWNWSTRGVYRYGPTPGVVLTVEFDGPPKDRVTEVTASEIEVSLQKTSGTDIRVNRLYGQGTRWTDNARQADAYRNRRVFLAGDAAHVHSPFSGQGLNLGLGDATNLGWKLCASIAGWAPQGLLDSYNDERHPVGEWVLEWTRAQIALMRPEKKVAPLRRVVAELMNTADGMTQMVNKISGITQRIDVIDVNEEHPLHGRLIPDITFKDGGSARSAFTDGRFVLLDRTPDSVFVAAAASWRERANMVTGDFIANDAELLAILARPDGVIVWTATDDSGSDAHALQATLTKWAGNGIGV